MNKAITLEEFKALFQKELKEDYPAGEIDAFFFLSIDEIAGIVREDFMLRKGQAIKLKQEEKLHTVIHELKTHKPIQYILGITEFYKCKLRVNPHVLIPRPETEELIEFMLQGIRDMKLGSEGLDIFDIGTGSGCIAIALKKKMPGANVSAIDISEDALLVAKANAILNQTKIHFFQGDILSPFPEGKGAFDIIVSNPPYVRLSEKDKMSSNVVDFEPPTALFVNDNDPLLFYKAIANFALQNLRPAGKLYFEINEALGNDVKKMLEEKGFKTVEIKKDMSGKERMVLASRL